MGPGILPETTVGKHNPPCHLQMQLKLYHAKRKPYVNMVQKRRRVLWAKAHLKWTVSKWKSVLWSDESKFDILVGNHGRCVLRAKEEETFQRVISIQFKSQHLWWYGVHKCIQYGQLACFGRHYECWKVYKGFRATYAPLQTMCISAGQCKTTYCSYYNSIRSRRVRLLNWPACGPDLSPIGNIWRIIKRKIRQRRPQNFQQLET